MECLNNAQKRQFDEDGYLVIKNQISGDWLEKIRAEITRFEAEAAMLTSSNERLDLEDSHTQENPRLRRIQLPHKISKIMLDLMYSDVVLGPARDLIGPNLRLHTTKLNMKSAGYGGCSGVASRLCIFTRTPMTILLQLVFVLMTWLLRTVR